MRQLIRTLLPYCMGHKWSYVLGFSVVTLANYLYVRAIVWGGRTADYILSEDMTMRGVWWRVGAIIGMVTVGAVAHYYQRILIIGNSRKIEFEFRNSFFAHLLSLSPSFFDRMKTGDLISRATDDIEQVRMSLGPGILYPLTAITIVPFTVWSMWQSSWPVTAICLLPMLVLPVVVNVLSRLMYRYSFSVQSHLADFSGRIQESIMGVRVIKSFAREEREIENLDTMNDRNMRLNLKLALVRAAFHPVMIFLFVLGTILILWVSSHYVTNDHAAASADARLMTKGQLVAFILLYRNLFFPLLSLGWVMGVVQRASASMERLQLILRQKPDIADTDATRPDLPAPKGEVEFRNVTFTYPGAEEPALRDVSFRIAPGESMGIVGAVGSGKSTIAHLLLRLYDPPPSSVFLDGVDVRDYPLDQLRRSVGIVFQETYLFAESVLDNIRFGRPDETPPEAVERYARAAAVHDDIADFPEGYGAVVGERGVNLSGGQKQRIALARLLAHRAPVMLLDDAFASVDTNTEERILRALREELTGHTALIVSHRISAVKTANHIIVLDDARIVEEGGHDALVRRDGLYADIHRRQLLEEAIERSRENAEDWPPANPEQKGTST